MNKPGTRPVKTKLAVPVIKHTPSGKDVTLTVFIGSVNVKFGKLDG